MSTSYSVGCAGGYEGGRWREGGLWRRWGEMEGGKGDGDESGRLRNKGEGVAMEGKDGCGGSSKDASKEKVNVEKENYYREQPYVAPGQRMGITDWNGELPWYCSPASRPKIDQNEATFNKPRHHVKVIKRVTINSFLCASVVTLNYYHQFSSKP